MNKINETLDTAALIRIYSDKLNFRAANPIELLPFGLKDSDGWQLGAVETPEGIEVVVYKGGVAWVAIYDQNGNFAGKTCYHLSRYFVEVKNRDGSSFVDETREGDLDDTNPTAVTTGLADDTQVVGLDQFYYSNGYFRLECSTPLPAQAMAAALLAAWKSIEEVANAAHGEGGNKSHA